MVKPYNEKTFAIDMIVEVYKNIKSPVQLSLKCKEDLDTIVTPAEIMDYLDHTEDFERESARVNFSIHSSEIFNKHGYE